MCNVCNACNASLCSLLRVTSLLVRSLSSLFRMLLSIFLGKCLFFQEKLRKRIVQSISRQETLLRIVANAAVERGSQGGQSNGDSIGSNPVLPTNNTRIAADCCDITISKSRWECSEAECKRPMLQQVLQPAAYPERELRRIVCWLLILSAEIWKIYSSDCSHYIKSAQSVRIAHSVFERSFFTKSSQSSQSSHILE